MVSEKFATFKFSMLDTRPAGPVLVINKTAAANERTDDMQTYESAIAL